MSVVIDRLRELVLAALDAAEREGILAGSAGRHVDFERPKRAEHGDWSTNVALTEVKASSLGSPRALAEALIERIPASELVKKVEVAGPGFMNFHLAPAWLHDVVRRAATEDSGFGRSTLGAGIKVNVEYVSANPTGPVNVISGRHAAIGDAVSNLLEATGHSVTRECYLNDAGRQIKLFAASVAARYLQEHGIERDLPEDGYQGDYIIDLARDVGSEIGESLVDSSDEERDEAIGRLALERMVAGMKTTLERFGTRFDVWFSERSLHEAGAIDASIERLRSAGYVEEREGALWFRSSELGDDKDRVLIRSDGEPTYLAADTAYILDKFGRGFDRAIYYWGADHHGTIARLMAAAEALGLERGSVEITLIQIVSILRGGDAVKGSKRAGVIVPLDELIDEVGVDAARYMFLQRSHDAPLDFDMDLAKQQAPENPVYYVQYAHARIASILRKALEEGAEVDVGGSDLSLLEHDSEDALMRKLATYEDVIPEAAKLRAPQRLTRYVEELAAAFSAFYRDCKVVTDDAGLTSARLTLCLATKAVVADGLGLLGVRAPERM